MAEAADATRPGTPALTIDLLGPLTVRVDGTVTAVGGRRQAAVLVALVLQRGRATSTDALVEAVWPGAKPARPLPALHAYISHLRKRLAPQGSPGRLDGSIEHGGGIHRVGPGYALRIPDDAVDAWRFESLMTTALTAADPAAALTQALALWRGAALTGYADEEWARPSAERWAELHAVARERLYTLRLAAGESALLTAELEAFVAEAPLREERWRLLVLALYQAHRQADALDALRRVRALLADELGLDPGPALRTLESEILAQSSTLEPIGGWRVPTDTVVNLSVRVADSTPPTPFPIAPSHRDEGSDIVERESDLAIIATALRSAAAGDGSIVLIEGPAGIGKTRLLREVRTMAPGIRVLAARGSQLEREYGFGVVRQLLEPVVTHGDPTALFAGAAGAARGLFESLPATGGAGGGESTFAVLHGLYWLTTSLAGAAPLIITVDDVQWCDVGSLRFLGFLAHRIIDLPVLLVVTLRTGEPHQNEDLLAEIVSEASVLVVSPRPLSSSGVNDLVRTRLGGTAGRPDDAFVAACRRTTGGNPLLLRQLLRALEADGITPTASNVDTVRAIGSRAVSSLVLRRFSRMPPENRAAARAVAILGDGATVPRVAELTGLSQAAVAEAVGALARAEVLRHDYPLEFVHPLVQDAVYGDIPLGTREMQHEQAARMLGTVGAPAEQIAAHLLKTPTRGNPATVETLRAAAARSAARGAPDGAATYLRRALAEPAGRELEPRLYLELGHLETQTDVPAALEHLTVALHRLTDIRERAQAAVMLGRVEIFAGGRGTSQRTADEIIDQLPPELHDERQWLQAISRVSAQMHLLGRHGGPYPEIVGTGPGAVSLAAAIAWDISRDGADRPRAIELAGFALAGDLLDDVDQGFLGVVARIVLEITETAPPHQWDDALATAYRKGNLFAVLAAHVWGGHSHWVRGDLDEALQWLRNCAEQIGQWGAPQIAKTYADAFMLEVLIDRGDLAGAQALVATEQPYWQFISESHVLLLAARARLLTQLGRHDRALVIHDRIDELTGGQENPSWRSWQGNRAQSLAAVGRASDATAVMESDLATARRWRAPRGLGRTLRILGTISGADGVDALRESIAVLETGTATLELAKANAALGEQLAGAGAHPPVEAVEALRTAALLAARCGAAGLAARVAQSLTRRGLEIPVPPARESLTSTERRMVEMSLDGAFDQEIAQALFVTTANVRQTLEDVRGRLGVTSAQQLRYAAG